MNYRYMNSLGNKRVELFDEGGVSEPTADDNVQMASCKTIFFNTHWHSYKNSMSPIGGTASVCSRGKKYI